MDVKFSKDTVEVYLLWGDLTKEARNKLRKLLNLGGSGNNNWDIFPITILEFDKKAYDITDEEVEL